MTQTVVILGAGIGGLVAANRLRRSLPKPHRVVLVDREASFVFAPSFLWLIKGDRTAQQISRPLSLLERKGIEVVCGEVEQIDATRRQVVVSGRTLPGDYLVLALGAEPAADAIPGLAETGYNFYTLSGAQRLREALAGFAGGRIVVLTAEPTTKSPATPCEAAMLLDYLCRKRKVRDDTQIDFYAAGPLPMDIAGPETSTGLLKMILSRGIVYHVEQRLVAADPGAKRLSFAKGLDVGYDLLAYVPPHRAPCVVREAGLTDESGWVPVDPETLETRVPGVSAVGDIVRIALKCGKALPKAGVFAHRQAEVVAKNLSHAITGKGRPAVFDGHGAFFVETGDGRGGFGTGDFYANPEPRVKLHTPGRHWHAAKVLLEKEWFRRWF